MKLVEKIANCLHKSLPFMYFYLRTKVDATVSLQVLFQISSINLAWNSYLERERKISP